MKHAIQKALIASTLTAALLASASATAFAAEDTSTADEVNPGNYEYTITDATNVQKAIAKISELTEQQEYLYDIDGSEGITISDATTIQKIVAKICGQPTCHEEEVITTVEHPAEYETVTEQEWVEGEETPVYIYDSRAICSCGKDLTPLIGRFDTAVANGELDPTDEKYGLEVIDGHYYSFYAYGAISSLRLLDETDTGIEDDLSRHINYDVSWIDEWHFVNDTVDYQWGWYTYNGPSNLSGFDLYKYFVTHDTELAYSGDTSSYVWSDMGNLECDEIRTDTYTLEDDYSIWNESFKVAVKYEEGHYEDVTKQVLVKEAWNEDVTMVVDRWYCD